MGLYIFKAVVELERGNGDKGRSDATKLAVFTAIQPVFLSKNLLQACG